MILVTGANGQYGSATINYLLEKGATSNEVIALVRNEESASSLKEKGIQVRQGDYNDYSSLVEAFRGVEKLVFISGSDIASRLSQHKNVVKAATEAGVKHIIYTSFQGKDETENSPLWVVSESHLQTEKLIQESGMDFTILKNNLYMDFVPAFVGEQVLETGLVYLPAEDGKVGAVLRAEMAEATAVITLGNKHSGKVYSFSNNEAFSYADVAQHISDIKKGNIKYISPTPEEYGQTLSGFGVPSDIIGLFTGFAVAQAKGELDHISTDLEKLLGRKPTDIKTFLLNVYSK